MFHSKASSSCFRLAIGYCILLLFPALDFCRQLHAQSAPFDAAFDSYVEKTLRDWQAPGVVISVVKDGVRVFARGYGTRKLGESLPPDENTLVQIASNTKPITAAALALLVDEGRLAWDDPVKNISRSSALRMTTPRKT